MIENKRTEMAIIMAEIENCNYWLDIYEAAGNSFCFDHYYCKREQLFKKLRGVHNNGTP